ncbi:MAG: dodecin domain-containing protein [Nitrososphaeria archaeon]|nr:dodecin domain-containing protein [Nitrososphaeria archaeon]NIN52344.1 dodecin domain-containing protein [Nitrososphaeria archaeon]NIQ32822.1 dodecin domain-containing protein [Nitrososphaeria archaeon]
MVVKIIEIIGSSPNSWEDALKNAVSEASKTVRNITRVEVKALDVSVENDKVIEFRVDARISFTVER